MSNVIQMPPREGSGSYFDRIRKRVPGATPFYAGVLLTLVLPQAACVAYAGASALVAFTATALAGSAWGLGMYLRADYGVASRADTRDVPQAPTRRGAPFKKAA